MSGQKYQQRILLHGEGQAQSEHWGLCSSQVAPRPSTNDFFSQKSAVIALLRRTGVSKSDHAAHGISRLPCVSPASNIF